KFFSSFLLLFLVAAAAQWANICSSQPATKIRGCDTKGCGGYNQPRGARRHGGVDVVCEDGSTIHALFMGRTDQQTRPYGNAIDDKVQLSGEGFCIKMFYIKPVKSSGPIRKGENIGVLLPMQSVYQGITSHVQNHDFTDPTPYL
ncbi:LECT2 protein, partial [Nothoprocta ornata]|nr:LECT2 protein [Nothoprocta ornata]